jgi:ribonuclease P protein component
MIMHLRSSSEFQRVYRKGSRFDEPVLTAFVLPNGLEHHRLGITASRKAIGNAVKRNRVKRVLRETFRLSYPSFDRLARTYDWVLNGKSQLLAGDSTLVRGQFENILVRLKKSENASCGSQMA